MGAPSVRLRALGEDGTMNVLGMAIMDRFRKACIRCGQQITGHPSFVRRSKFCGWYCLERSRKVMLVVFPGEARLITKSGHAARISLEDLSLAYGLTWSVDSGGYLCNKRGRYHALLLGTPTREGLVADHINRDKLDNRRENLRLVTPRLNAINSKRRSDSRALYKGVKAAKGRWQARIGRVHLGTYDTPEQAAAVRLDAEARLWGCHEG